MEDFDYRCAVEKPDCAILDLPTDQRPRERLLSKGAEALSDLELLAILLRTGMPGKNVISLSEDVLDLLDKTKGIPSPAEIAGIPGMGDAKTCIIAAMLEFGLRRWGERGRRVRSPSDIYSLVRHYADRKQERFISISLNGAHEALSVHVVTVGLVNRTIVHPREVFADLIQDRASAFCVAHNHPSGQLDPSPEDDEITLRLQHSSDILGINFLDHLIFSDKLWWSYRQNNRITGQIQP
ncbi:MAG: DNA repair protein RadC [Treponema sp.]|nr:DNA repair protein RadC [Treponema sp.]